MSGSLDFVYDSPTFIDLYEILEVEMDAKADEIKTAYIKMAKKNHPDQGGSTEKFQEITRAYEIIYNKETRKEYDLYYLKKNMDEFMGDDILKLKSDFQNFMVSNSKPISKEELDKLYAETFGEYREQYKDTAVGQEEFMDKFNDVRTERKNMEIETSDDALSNFISQHKDQVNVNDVFEYFKCKNSKSFSNSIIAKEWGTIDTMPGYSNGYSSFMDDNEHFDSNLYSNISDANATLASEATSNLNLDDFMQWKTTKHTDTKLTDGDINVYLKRREEEQENIFNDVQKNLESNVKVKEIEKFLKTKHLKENVDEYYNNLNKSSSTGQISKFKKSDIKKSNLPEIVDLDDVSLSLSNSNSNSNSTDIDGMLKFMDEINCTNKQDFGELEKEIGIDKIVKKQDEFSELKSGANIIKATNVRKREFK